MQRFIVCSLDVLENGGFEINDMWRQGTIELDNWADFHDIVGQLVENGSLSEGCTLDKVRFHGDDTTIYVDDRKTGRPLFHLIPE